MAKLIYASNMSIDGFTEDADGDLSWAPPDDGVFAAITEVMAAADTYLYGRRMYETMAVWETDPTLGARSELTARYAEVWQSADKIVYSSTLPATSTAKTQLERRFDPEAVRDMKSVSSSSLLIGGPTLAAHAFAAGLVDEVELFVWPFVLAGCKPALSPNGGPAELELVDERRFGSGAVHLRYRTR